MGTSLPIALGGRVVAGADDLVRRYAGMHWSGGPPEVWAFPFYDAVPAVHDDVVSRVDVLAASVLHPGLSRTELAFFIEHADELTDWLRDVPPDQTLWDADAELLSHLDSLTGFADAVSLGLVTKVLHRKRPDFVPLLDRHVVDHYRPITGVRRPVAAWPPVVRALLGDLDSAEKRALIAAAAAGIRPDIAPHEYQMPLLRYVDIALWMAAR